MRIAFFSDTFFPQINGVVNVVHHLAESLSRRGHEVCVVTVSGETAAATEQRPDIHYRIITIPSVPMPLYPGERLTLPIGWSFPKMKEFNPDIIHAHTPFTTGREAYLCARRFGAPLVGTHHTFFDHYLQLAHLDYRWMRRLSWKMTNRYYNRCTAVVTPTRALAGAMEQHGLYASVKIIPNPAPLSDFKPRETKLNKKEATIVYMGRLSPEKNIDKVLEAYAHILAGSRPAQNRDVRLVIIGGGPYQRELEDKADALGIRNRITFTGFLRGAKLVEELRTHDVFITASKSENMPVSVLEAMASGLPIVAVSALGLPEIIHHGENGFLVAPDDTVAMAKRIEEIVDNPALQKRFAAASRELALGYAPDLIASLHEELYTKLLSDPMVQSKQS